MAYDEELANRIRRVLGGRGDFDERKMFGGLAFMVRGHMACGVVADELMLRVGPQRYEETLRRPHARPMDFTGRPLTGLVYVGQPGLDTNRALAAWVDQALAFVATLPRKAPRARRPRRQLRRRPRPPLENSRGVR